MKLLLILVLALTSCSLSRDNVPLNLDGPAAPKPLAPPVPPVVSSPDDTKPPVTVPADSPVFAEVREKVFKPSCFGCHSEPGGNVSGINLEMYESAFEARFAVMTAVSEGRMPPRKALSEDQQKILVAWVTGGAKP